MALTPVRCVIVIITVDVLDRNHANFTPANALAFYCDVLL